MPVETETQPLFVRVPGGTTRNNECEFTSVIGCQTTENNEYVFTSITGHQKRIKALFNETPTMPSNINIAHEDADDCVSWYGPLVKYAINGRIELCVIKHDVADTKLRSMLGKVVSIEEELPN